jgi:hypothetical protein
VAGPVHAWGLAFVVFILAVGLIQYRKDIAKKKYGDDNWLPYFSRNSFDPDRVRDVFQAELESGLCEGLPQENQNLVVYQGFSPFVGAGYNLGGWSFAINLTRPKSNAMGETLDPTPFQVCELYATIEQAHQSLEFKGFATQDMFFVNGQAIRDDRALLPRVDGRPIQNLEPKQAAHYVASSDLRIRHYKWLRVHYPDENLVVSFFLRCAIQGHNLFCEINRFVLTPLADIYAEIDRQKPGDELKGWRGRANSILRTTFNGVGSAFAMWGLLLEWTTSPLQRFFEWRRKRREEENLRKAVLDNVTHNYGAAGSIREQSSSFQHTHYFQLSDRGMYVKIIDRTILDAIVDFVDAHNIDTSELKERRTTILNSGVIVQGGNLEAENLAVGTGAQAVQQRPAPTSTKES